MDSSPAASAFMSEAATSSSSSAARFLGFLFLFLCFLDFDEGAVASEEGGRGAVVVVEGLGSTVEEGGAASYIGVSWSVEVEVVGGGTGIGMEVEVGSGDGLSFRCKKRWNERVTREVDIMDPRVCFGSRGEEKSNREDVFG